MAMAEEIIAKTTPCELVVPHQIDKEVGSLCGDRVR